MLKKQVVVAVDGPDCTRKTTAVACACRQLVELFGLKVQVFSEPGGSGYDFDAELRHMMLHDGTCTDRARRWMMLASHTYVQAVIAKSDAHVILLDRYGPTSAYAYQVCGQFAPEILMAAYEAETLRVPDKIFIVLHDSAEESWAEIEKVAEPDLVESKGQDYHGLVYAGFEEQARFHERLKVEDSIDMGMKITEAAVGMLDIDALGLKAAMA